MKSYNTKASYEEVSALLTYDPETGLLRHKVNGHKRKAGDVVGRLDAKGYVRVRLLGYEFKAHRLAWLMTYKVWPENEIDHINGCPSDNRIVNLRDVSVAVNGQNRTKAMKNNRTGLLGVSECDGRYVAQIGVDGNQYRIGVFDTPQEAHEAYLSVKALYHAMP
jgi:hypothetical protein